jgi:Inner membrane protein YgaP-like, transmembrane domain
MNRQNPLVVPLASRGWTIERTVRGIAGILVLASAGLALLDERWLLLAAFVGLNLLQSSLTGWCLMNNLVAMLGVGRPDRA